MPQYQTFDLNGAAVRQCELRASGFPTAQLARERAVCGRETGRFIVLLAPGQPLTCAEHRQIVSYSRGDPFHGLRLR